MGELSGLGDTVTSSPETQIQQDLAAKDGKIETDVDGIFADAEKSGLPVFDVSKEEFFNNMKMDRKRLRFKRDSIVSKYMRNTKYNRSFYVRNTEDGYLRKIK
jgi:predicted phage-related endonuclease